MWDRYPGLLDSEVVEPFVSLALLLHDFLGIGLADYQFQPDYQDDTTMLRNSLERMDGIMVSCFVAIG